MKLKLDDDGHVAVQDGKPVYVDDSDNDVVFDAPHLSQTIKRLNSEAKGHREAKEKAEKELKAFGGISDPEAAIKALETIGNLDDKQLVDAGEVEKVKKKIREAFEEKFAAASKTHADELAKATERNAGLQSALNKEVIGGSFSRSKFIADKLAIPSDLAQSQFGKYFSLEDGNLVAKDASGNLIYGTAKPGEAASFEEAIELIVDGYANKDQILKGMNSQGGGSMTSSGTSGPKTITRTEFDKLSRENPAAAAAKMKDGYTLTN